MGADLTTAFRCLAGSTSTVAAGESFPARRDAGAVRPRHLSGDVTDWAGPWPCPAEVPIGTRSPSSHRAARSSSSPHSPAVRQATPPIYHAKRPTRRVPSETALENRLLHTRSPHSAYSAHWARWVRRRQTLFRPP